MATAVVCDDDGVTRSAVTTICEDAGLEVVAETESGAAALDLVQRFDVDVLILDQSLPDMSGEGVLRRLQEVSDAIEIIIFSAYVTDPYHLIGLGARDVVDKPDFERLGEVIEGMVLSLAEAAERADQDRRTRARRVGTAADVPRSEAGIASADDLIRSGSHTVVGDSVLVVTLADAAAGPSGSKLAELLHGTLRVQDILHERPGGSGYVAILRGGDEQAPDAVWQRLVALAADAGIADRLQGACRHIDELGLLDAIERAEDVLARAPEGRVGLQPA